MQAKRTNNQPTIKIMRDTTPLDWLETRLIISHVTGLSHVQIITQQDLCLSVEHYQQLQDLITRRLKGEPMAYILGYKEFYSRQFIVTPDTLIPRPETELLVDKVLSLASTDNRVLELGTGSGCIAITCKLHRPDLALTAVDKYLATLRVAQLNARNLGARVSFICADWFSGVTGKFDIIVSNPPYIALTDNHLLQLGYEPQHALTDYANGYECIEHIIAQSVNYLQLGGYLVIEHGYDQELQVQRLFAKYGFTNIVTEKDYAGLPRMTYAVNCLSLNS